MKPLLLALLLCAGCAQRDRWGWTYTESLPALDSSRIRPGRVANLDDLKGIDLWRLGMPKSHYRGAFPSDSAYRSDTCRAIMTVRDFGEDCDAELFLEDDTLARIGLNFRLRDARLWLRKLTTLCGPPANSSFDTKFTFDSTVLIDPAKKSEYREDRNVLMDSLLDRIDYQGPLYRDNITHLADLSQPRWPADVPLLVGKVIYFPRILSTATWKSKRMMVVNLRRDARVLPGDTVCPPLLRVHFIGRIDFF